MIDPQRAAADPRISAFVTANAGSGKTTTLVDRVARLLLLGARPDAILCLTYTKAAAAEMQRRLFEQLGGWAVLEDRQLREKLDLLTGEGAAADAAQLSAARALFARALETPGGLKILTIHAFCEKLLRRFPLEAQVSPGFRVMDDADAAAIVRAARDEVARYAMRSQGAVAEAYARLSVALAFDDFEAMFATFEAQRAAIGAYVARCGGPEGVAADVWSRCGRGAPTTEEAVRAEVLAPPAFDSALWRDVARLLIDGGKPRDMTAGTAMLAAADPAGEAEARFSAALSALFTERGEGGAATWVAGAVVLREREDLRERLLAEQDRLGAARERLRAVRVAQDTIWALALAQTYGAAYEASKQARSALDFADLIHRTCALLNTREDAAWVLYKLDGGVDHILIDEAQDTAPAQWEIVRALAGEFFAGAGIVRLRETLARSLFVVGDEKQSIYSFQGAEPDRLRAETSYYLEVIRGADQPAEAVKLTRSWRSTPQVLAFVDGVFADRDLWRGVPPPMGEDAVRHIPTRLDRGGCIDLWPLEREEAGEPRDAWDDPVDAQGLASANRRLALKIAEEIAGLIARGEAVYDSRLRVWRGAHAGDVLILVRRRGVLFEEILRALKQSGVAVAGADRLSLSQHIVFDDLLALARFIQFPGDDLTLAALLKSPLCGLDEDDLYALARERPGPLWTTLLARADERDAWRRTCDWLQRARTEGRRRRPFDFFSRLLGWADADGRSTRARILTRLGAEAQDVLDAFLAQTLAAERSGVADLEQLCDALDGVDITVKREMEGARDAVRVMTVHGAKGLEAPIVFLPETTLKAGARSSPLLAAEDGGFLWCASAKRDCEASAAARAWRARREAEEGQRLLYVALTRARDRLVLCGRINAKVKLESVGGWYGAAEAAFARPELADHVRMIKAGDMDIRRLGPDPTLQAPSEIRGMDAAPIPAWLNAPATPESISPILAPSRLGAEPPDLSAVPSPLDRLGGLGRFRRGNLIHSLLQLLPELPWGERGPAAARWLMRQPDLSAGQQAEIAGAALGVLNDPQFADVFGPGSRAEAAIAGRAPGLGAVSGRVDRLVVQDGRVLAIDFKTNRPSPSRIEDADPTYVRQMAVYAAMLGVIFPGRRIETALVWTDGPKLMTVPENIRAKALAEILGSVDS